jgi:hypothetical protein
MWKATLLTIALCLKGGSGQTYTGPKCLGLYCIDRTVPVGVLFKQLGAPAPRRSKFEPYCYESQGGHAFLYIDTVGPQPKVVGDVFLSDFPNCSRLRTQSTAADLGAWKTPEGIGLGSSEEEVRKAYGKPSSDDKLGPQTYRTRIKGFRPEDRHPDMGERSLFYNGDVTTDLSAAEFGVRNGKVSYVWLSYNE